MSVQQNTNKNWNIHVRNNPPGTYRRKASEIHALCREMDGFSHVLASGYSVNSKHDVTVFFAELSISDLHEIEENGFKVVEIDHFSYSIGVDVK